MPSPLIPL
jgi:hypothetical protein